jgi:superkiller protein 3
MVADATLASARAGLANALLAQGKAAEAVKEARAATEADNNSVEAHAALGTAILASDPKLWNDAIASAQQAVFLAPKNVAAQIAVAHIFEAGGNLAQAANAYKNALAADPDYVPAMTGSIQMLARQGKYDEALAQAKQLAAARPNSGSAQMLLGTMLARREQWADAATALQKATQLGVNTAEAYAFLGTAMQYTRRSPEALAAYKKAVELDPRNFGYRTTYGLLLGISEQEAAGIAELQKVVGDPAYKDADAWINLGWLYRSMEPINAAESVKAYTKALQIEANNTQALLGLAWAQYYNKEYDAAAATFVKVATADESLAPGAYSGAGWSYLFKKDLVKAEEFAGKAEAAGRNDTKLREQIAAVKAGREAQQRAIDRKAEEAARPAPVVAETCDSATQLLLYGRDGGSRQRAAGRIKGLCGAAGVDTLVSAIAQEKSGGVRVSIAQAIGSYGTAGKKADVHLRQILEGLKCGEVIPSKECLEREQKNAPVIAAVTAAIRAVNGR